MCQFTIRRKKQLTYAVIGMVFLFGGIEYAVILPTMWLYIEARFNAEQYFLGLMLAAFCFSGLFSGPLMGRWSDVTRKTKLILLFANCWEIAGNIMYFIGLSKWFLFASRLVSGVGAGAEATLIAELARETKADQRTGVLSLFIAVRQFGLLIGPGFNLFLRKLNFHIGPFLVDKYSAPGVFMAVLWTLLQLIIICFYSELPSLNTSAEESHDKKSAASAHTQSPTTYTTRLPQASENSSFVSNIPSANVSSAVNINTGSLPPEKSINYDEEFCENTNVPSSYPQLVLSKSSQLHEHEDFLNSSDLIESAERFITSDNPDTSTKLSRQHSHDRERTLEGHSSYGSVHHHPHRGEQTQSQNGGLATPPDTSTVIVRTKRPWLYYYNEYMREPVVVLLGIQFIGLFNQVALETMITPLTQKYLGWGELENSLMYCGAGAQIIAVFFLVRWLSKRLLDRTMILIGCSVLTIANCWLVWVIPNAVPDSMSKNLAKFLVGLVLDMFALPFLIVCSVSLYSKVTHKETQGFSQGLRRSVCGVATIMGPLWAGSALPWPYVMLGVMLGLISVATIMLLVSFPCLNVSEDVDKKIQDEGINNSDNDETKPLLS